MTASLRPGWLRRTSERLGLFAPRFGEAATRAPELLHLPAAEGAAASGAGAAPVRIFVGTHPGDFRALRVLVWSLGRLRDPARDYEVHVLSNLAGLPRRRWRSPDEGYRALVPDLAGGAGRAIHCTARTVFLEDPARLLGLPMAGADWLAPARAGGPALLDCAALAPRWRREALARGTPPRRIEARACPGPLPERWAAPPDAADAGDGGAGVLSEGWVAGAGGSALARLWNLREAEADAAGFLPFTRARPTREFRELIGLYRRMHDAGAFPGVRLKHHLGAVRALLDETGGGEGATLLDYGAGKAEGYALPAGAPPGGPWRCTPAWPGVGVRCYDPGVAAFPDPGAETFDGVISTDVVEHLSPWDVAWVLEDMFARARRFVFVVAACYPAVKRLPDGRNAHTTQQPHGWWREQMRLAARRHPGVRWRLGCDDRGAFGKRTTLYDD